ncbi:hypothetical protein D9619_000192 [Psilocybe cf. subviscida]|uniref:Uncharacterized protein n=1 Tax=Psilocybe cf. subviscida TaxID=2480587 RepID=A0A8H5F2K5_9AGAR|nr:hypothetical protein D9619_000192 [Psilocybe cf. subviscida]
MSSNSRKSDAIPKASRSAPYQKSARPHTSKSSRRKTTAKDLDQRPPAITVATRPPLQPGEESAMDVMREIVKKKYPLFNPRHSADIVQMSGPYDGPTDHKSICAFMDQEVLADFAEYYKCSTEKADAILSEQFDADIGRTSAREVLGVRIQTFACRMHSPSFPILQIKPRPGQKFCVRAIPACPEYSIRLWASSPYMRQFGMDFIESATGTPVNLSHRFHVFGTGYLLGSDQVTRTMPFAQGFFPHSTIQPGEELYHVHEEQGVIIRDVTHKKESGLRAVTFKVPKHPAKPPQLPSAEEFDVLHFSVDE